MAKATPPATVNTTTIASTVLLGPLEPPPPEGGTTAALSANVWSRKGDHPSVSQLQSGPVVTARDSCKRRSSTHAHLGDQSAQYRIWRPQLRR
eukprot:1186956-Prorocentrum_minimum.AAC.2